ncbi:hypothetical protein [Kitasatospora sp. NPDC059571]|uniref:hypothetical protein n=1 Tax=Kitasatospora sp. NPDC059571 TaxID=3346871 RepID=UPI0036B71CC2
MAELADPDLGKLLSRVAVAGRAPEQDFVLAAVQRLLEEAGRDWDRCTHRMRVLARSGIHGIAHGWYSRRPDDPYALMLYALSCLTGGAAEPYIELADVESLCRRSARLLPAHPSPHVVLLAALRRLQRPAHEVFEVWKEATARDPWHREAHRQMLRYLSPDECGSAARALDFADKVRATMPPGVPSVGLHLAALTDSYHCLLSGQPSAPGIGQYWTAPLAQQAMDDAAAQWLKPGFLAHAAAPADLNLLAYVLVQAERFGEAAATFRALGPTVTEWPWCVRGDAVRQFTYWQDRLLV